MTTHTSLRSDEYAPAADSRPGRLLRATLRVNAGLSALSGLAMTVVPERLDRVLDTGHPGWVRVVGIAFLVFAAEVALLSFQPDERLRRFAPVVVTMDSAYVAASIVTIVAGWYSAGGSLLVASAAVPVAAFAVLQFRGWQRLR
ncbi:MAG: hypothetical protein WBP59_02915 [Ilumatobacteraceae bacterium]